MIEITSEARKRIGELLSARGVNGGGLRISARDGGCSGLLYGMGVEDAPTDDDTILDVDGIRVFIDPRSGERLTGAVVDWVDGPGGSGFRITNPAAGRDGDCSCRDS